jgi:hypothetical protein
MLASQEVAGDRPRLRPREEWPLKKCLSHEATHNHRHAKPGAYFDDWDFTMRAAEPGAAGSSTGEHSPIQPRPAPAVGTGAHQMWGQLGIYAGRILKGAKPAASTSKNRSTE